MVGGTVSYVEVSSHPSNKVGDMVLSHCGWQDYAISDGKGLIKFNVDKHHPTLALGVLSMAGFTAYMGFLNIGQPKSGDPVVVAAASGTAGVVVEQIAKIKQCRAIGSVEEPEKCRYVVDVLGLDACIDHSSPDFSKQLAVACPKGIDVYFKNVSGAVFDAVLPMLNTKMRIPLCGLVANYNDTALPKLPDRLGLLTSTILSKCHKLQAFFIFEDYAPYFPKFFGQISAWLWENRIKYREDIVDGLKNAPEALIGLSKRKSFGKLIIRVSD